MFVQISIASPHTTQLCIQPSPLLNMDSAANAFLGKCRNLKSGDINLKSGDIRTNSILF